MNRILLFCILFLFSLRADAQEMWGISNSNYSGNMGIYLNPSTIVGAPYGYEFNFLAADLYLENTFFHYDRSRHIVMRAIAGNTAKETLSTYNTTLSQRGFAHALIIGPAYIVNKGDFSWGWHTAFRTELSALGVAPQLAQLSFEKFHYLPAIGLRVNAGGSRAAFMSFLELGGTYGRFLNSSEENSMKFAVTGNILLGMDGLFLDARKLDYTMVDSTTMVLHNVDATIGHALDPNNSGKLFGVRGIGLSTTVGITYTHNLYRGAYECNKFSDHYKKYKYRVGLSLLDLGLIDFFRKSQVAEFSTTADRPWVGIDTASFKNVAAFDTRLSGIVNGTTNSMEDKAFSMLLPTALSLQIDYCVKRNVYVNGSVVQRLYFSPKQIARPNQYSISARYEIRAFEAAIDYSRFEYKQSHLGLGFRLAWFVIGTDRLSEIFGMNDVKSFDIFFGFKWNTCRWPFGHKRPACPAFGGF